MTNGIPLPHPWSVNLAARRADPARCQAGTPRRRACRDRQPALGHGVPARTGRVPAHARPAALPLRARSPPWSASTSTSYSRSAESVRSGSCSARATCCRTRPPHAVPRQPGRHAGSPSPPRRPHGAGGADHLHADVGAPSGLHGGPRESRPARLVAPNGRDSRPQPLRSRTALNAAARRGRLIPPADERHSQDRGARQRASSTGRHRGRLRQYTRAAQRAPVAQRGSHAARDLRDARPLQQRRLQVRRHGHRIYVTSNKDQAPSNLVVIQDPSCAE